jgi:hypothetical protein
MTCTLKVATHDFQYEVFLSQNAKDITVVRPLAERLRAHGLEVWLVPPTPAGVRRFHEWVLKPGDSIAAKIEAGLKYPRMLARFGVASQEGRKASMFRVRHPLNQECRSISLRFDGVNGDN